MPRMRSVRICYMSLFLWSLIMKDFVFQVELKEKAQTFEAKDFNTLNSEAGASAN